MLSITGLGECYLPLELVAALIDWSTGWSVIYLSWAFFKVDIYGFFLVARVLD
jgi:hypothetical protein